MRDLRKAEDSLFIARVEAVNEQQNTVLLDGRDPLVEAPKGRARSIFSAERVANSVAGLAGRLAGHCTSPIVRPASGGIEIEISA
jgi:hypothetical protein